MSNRGTMDVLEVLSRYAAGYFPLYDPWGQFYWERLSVRAMLPVNGETVARAGRMARRGRRSKLAGVEIRYNTAVAEIIGYLRREDVKENSWVREQVVAIYGALHAVGLLQTVEAWKDGKLVGGLVGIVLPGTFIAETMFGLVPEASKICLCRLVEDCFAAGFEMIDVQTPHDLDEFGLPVKLEGKTAHPCIRLGEQSVSISVFMRLFQAAWKKAFPETARDWVGVSLAMHEAARRKDLAGRMPEGIAAETWRRAYELLRHTLPGDFSLGEL